MKPRWINGALIHDLTVGGKSGPRHTARKATWSQRQKLEQYVYKQKSQNFPATTGSVKARKAPSPDVLEGAWPCFHTLASSALREDISVVAKRLSRNSVLCHPQETNTLFLKKNETNWFLSFPRQSYSWHWIKHTLHNLQELFKIYSLVNFYVSFLKFSFTKQKQIFKNKTKQHIQSFLWIMAWSLNRCILVQRKTLREKTEQKEMRTFF